MKMLDLAQVITTASGPSGPNSVSTVLHVSNMPISHTVSFTPTGIFIPALRQRANALPGK